jgi:very-short-patch-repair endonuclease
MKLTVFVLSLIAILILIVVVIAIKRKKGTGGGGDEWPYYAKRLLTQPEQILYHRLAQALPDHIVLAQVQVSRVLGVKKGFNFQQWNNRINRMSYDFIVCTKDSTPIAVIELDDKTHEQQARVEADQKKNAATNAAGLKVIRWNVKSIPDMKEIQAQLIAEKFGVTKSNPAPN